MDDAKRELVRAWLIKARNDLTTAREVGGLPEGPLDTAIYHCQRRQIYEELNVMGTFESMVVKREKTFYRFFRRPAYEACFKNYEEAAVMLTPYATAYRYPGESATMEPSRAEFEER